MGKELSNDRWERLTNMKLGSIKWTDRYSDIISDNKCACWYLFINIPECTYTHCQRLKRANVRFHRTFWRQQQTLFSFLNKVNLVKFKLETRGSYLNLVLKNLELGCQTQLVSNSWLIWDRFTEEQMLSLSQKRHLTEYDIFDSSNVPINYISLLLSFLKISAPEPQRIVCIIYFIYILWANLDKINSCVRIIRIVRDRNSAISRLHV